MWSIGFPAPNPGEPPEPKAMGVRKDLLQRLSQVDQCLYVEQPSVIQPSAAVRQKAWR